MPFVTTMPVTFPCSRATVYRALCDLKSYPLWNSGMITVSEPGPLREGLAYDTYSILPGGQTNRARINVVRLEKDEEIELASKTGAITYNAIIRLSSEPSGHTTVVCELKFEFTNFVLNLTKGAVEAIAGARMQGDYEALRALICPPAE
ncbi:MAG: Polyketide cyclase / dehydrase and lipid transport [Patescibacteria group bacterium]|jgi:uncharacterized protein YndB with AHSA1/START domain|nr:Polyketide cyclase / dehydrase and lipid transport [Patescibacteria group bacterium]